MDQGENIPEAVGPLTVASAAELFERHESLLSDYGSEESQAAATPPEPDAEEREAPQPEDSADTEQVEPEEESPNEDEDEEPAPQPQTRRFKHNGEDVEVTLEELEKSYLRQSDYTRKTQELAKQRQEYEAERDRELPALKTQREEYAQRLTHLVEALKSQQASVPEPDWNKLRQELPPDQYAAARVDWAEYKKQRDEQMTALQKEQENAAQKVLEDRRAEMNKHLQAEKAKLLEVFPSWKDNDVAKKELGDLHGFAKRQGFSDNELAAITDHRVYRMLSMAMKQEQAEKNKPAIRQTIEKVKAASPGTKTARKPVSDITRGKQRLAKTGSVQDAAALLMDYDLDT